MIFVDVFSHLSFTLTLFLTFFFFPHLNVPSPEIDYSTRLSSQVHSQSSRSAWLNRKRKLGPCEVLGYLHFCRINIWRSFSRITWEKEKKRGASTKIIAKYVVAYRLPQRLWACFIGSVAQKPPSQTPPNGRMGIRHGRQSRKQPSKKSLVKK